jgi:HPt (histidine-containing phosphotransfer) domain-containing protein
MYAVHAFSTYRGTDAGFAERVSDAPAIDLVYLARQTDGDTALESELLAMFDRQSEALLSRLSAAASPRGPRASLAHTLKGSALAIGAARVADAAGALEKALESEVATEGSLAAALSRLSDAVAESRAAIADLRG